MRNDHRSIARMLGVAAGLAGLLAAGTGDFEAAITRNKLASNKLASNRLVANKLASNRLASNRLASNALGSNRLEANQDTAELLATADGRDLYSYIVGCALPDGTTIEADVPGAPDTAPDAPYTCTAGRCIFSGALGLAAHWADRRLDPKGQRWVSACLLARVNLHETAESISLRGLAPELTVSQDEAEIYGLEEGAFYGNLFTDDDAPIDWNVCRGLGEAQGGGGGLELRDCAEADPADPARSRCGFVHAGDCADYTPAFPSPYACRSFDEIEGTFGDCHAGAGEGRWPGLRTYREVITVYVAN